LFPLVSALIKASRAKKNVAPIWRLFGLRRPCLCFGGRAKCFGANVATQAHADEVLAVSFGDAGHNDD